MTATVYAPAKVNLYLKILGERPDGYHNIETVFERIALSDRIALRSLAPDKIKIFCDHPDVPTGEEGLIHRTISLLKGKLGIAKGIEVKIFKRIPVASGLGGGSSDAASVLLALDKLWKSHLGLPALLKLGETLGSDIPFFLSGSSFAAGRGKGDEVTPLGWKAKFWHLLVTSPARLLSKDIYGMYRTGASSNPTENPRLNKILSSDERGIKFDSIKDFIANDLEGVVLEKEPLVGRIKKALKNICRARSLVSGSGPGVFSLFETRKEAVRAKKLLIRRFPVVKDKGWQIFIVPTL